MPQYRTHRIQAAADLVLPTPSTDSRWRWSIPGRALAGGGVLAAALALGTVTVGAPGVNVPPAW
jgi:hypothetical protein